MRRVMIAVAVMVIVIAGVGLHSLVGSVQAEPTAGNPGSAQTSIENAAEELELVKTVGLDPAVCATTSEITVASDTMVTYCYEVTNKGDSAVTRHDLVDSHLGTILSNYRYTLEPEASVFITQTAVITQTTVNTATWTAYNPGWTGVIQATDSATVTVDDTTLIAFTKTVGLDPAVCAGTDEITVGPNTPVTYCYEVTNTGGTTLGLHDLVDSELGVILDGFTFALAPQASVFLTQTAVITQTTVNTATWTAYNAGPEDLVEETDSATVTVVPPSIAFTKTVGLDPALCATTGAITVGPNTAVTYCYEVTNTGLTTLGLHDLVDSELGVILDGFTFALAPQASVFLTQTAVITQTTVNTATWTAYNAGPEDLVEETDSATVTVVPPSIAFTKTVGLDPALCATTGAITVGPNTAVTYCYEVTNTGLTTLGLHDLVDSELGVILDGFTFALAPQASVFLTQTAVITQTTVNTATWTAYNAGPENLVEETDSATVTVVPPSIAFTKTVGLDPALCATTGAITVGPNTAVTYCYEVTNTGLTTLGLHDLVDSELGVILDGFTFALAPQASVFLTQTAVITQTTVNTATWTAYNAGPTDVAEESDSATVTVIPDTRLYYLPLVLKK
jgi:hypothetical protein